MHHSYREVGDGGAEALLVGGVVKDLFYGEAVGRPGHPAVDVGGMIDIMLSIDKLLKQGKVKGGDGARFMADADDLHIAPHLKRPHGGLIEQQGSFGIGLIIGPAVVEGHFHTVNMAEINGLFRFFRVEPLHQQIQTPAAVCLVGRIIGFDVGDVFRQNRFQIFPSGNEADALDGAVQTGGAVAEKDGIMGGEREKNLFGNHLLPGGQGLDRVGPGLVGPVEKAVQFTVFKSCSVHILVLLFVDFDEGGRGRLHGVLLDLLHGPRDSLLAYHFA